MNSMSAQGMMGQFQYVLCHVEPRNPKKQHDKGECLFCLPAGLFTLSILLCARDGAVGPAAWLRTLRWWSEKFSASTIYGDTIGKIFFPQIGTSFISNHVKLQVILSSSLFYTAV